MSIVEEEMAVDIIPWGRIIAGQKQYPCHKDQKIVLNSEVRFTAAIAGTGV